MATTKRARYQFVVKEDPCDPYISVQPVGAEPLSERPLLDPDFLSFDLREGISLDEAQGITDFLNENLLSVAITRFGDAEDAAWEVKLSERVQKIDLERFLLAIASLKETFAANDVPAAVEATRAVQSVMVDLIRDWSKALAMSAAIVNALGEGGDYDAA